MVWSEDGTWRTLVNEALCHRQKLISMDYRSEVTQGLVRFGWDIDKSHADGGFKIACVPRKVIEAYSTQRAEADFITIHTPLTGEAADMHLTAGQLPPPVSAL